MIRRKKEYPIIIIIEIPLKFQAKEKLIIQSAFLAWSFFVFYKILLLFRDV